MFHFLQHAPLVIGVFDLLHFHHLGLLEHFDSIETLVVLGLDQMNPTEAACPKCALNGEISERVFPLGGTHLGLGSCLLHLGL